jgi:DNA-binding LacI/PurR family transcriptional regulator
LEQVGAVAGVSRATVSRVVNGSSKVSPEARVAVERAISTLGYAPNRAARTLVTQRTDTIALVVSEPESRVFSEPFFSAMVRGIGAALAESQFQLVMLLAQDEREHEKVERYIRNRHVDGVVLMSLHGDDSLPSVLAKAGMPTVSVGRPLGKPAVPYVDADNRAGAHLAVDLLVELGRRRIAAITGPQDMSAGLDRFEGYRDGLAAAGRKVVKALVEAGDFGEDSGYQAMRRLARRRPDVDAVFVASDVMAAGALRALRELGRRVPDDVAVIGFDDASVAAHTVPPLTTIRQPVDEMSRVTAELLLRQLTDGVLAEAMVICPTTLVRRGSA